MTATFAAIYAMGPIFAGPSADGTSGQAIVTNGSKVLSFASVLVNPSPAHVAIGADATVDGSCWATSRYAESVLLVKEEITESVVSGTLATGSASTVKLNLSGPSTTIAFSARDAWLETTAGNNENLQYIFGGLDSATHQSNGTVLALYGATHQSLTMSTAGVVTNNYGSEHVASGGVNVYASSNYVTVNSTYGSVSTPGTAYGNYNNIVSSRTNSSGTDKCYGSYSVIVRGPTSGGSNSIYGFGTALIYDTNIRAYDFFAAEHIPGSSTLTSYFVFLDSRAVYRIKDDGVMGYYNPTFAKYVPDATDYERIVQQWSSDVAQYGCEKGGTGTLRPLQLLGSYILVGGSTSAGEIRILEASGDGTNYVALKSQAISASHTITLPAADGTNGQFLKTNGSGVWSFATISGGGDALTTNPLSQFAATTSLELKGVISDETGSGALVFATSPTLVTPTLGVAAATTINKVALTAPATGSTLTIADGATLTVSASATITNGTHSGTNTGDQTTVSGNAGTVTVADAGGDTTTWVLLGTSQTGSLSPATDAGLTYNATTNALTATTFVGALTGDVTGNVTGSSGSCTGNAATVTTNANLTGDVTSSGNATTIASAAVTLAKMADLAQDQFIVRTTASTGVPQTATVTAAARTVLDDTTVSAMVDTLGGASATGTGGLARATSPTFVTPLLGTPTSGVLTNCTGTASGLTAGTCTTIPSLSGDVTSSSNAVTIANDAVTYAKLQNVSATDKVLGRSTSGSGDVEEIACTSFGRIYFSQGAEVTATITTNATTLALGSGVNHLLDFAASASGTVSITFSGAVTGITYRLRIKQGATARAITWVTSGLKWDSVGEPTWASDTSKDRIVTVYYNGTNYYMAASETYA